MLILGSWSTISEEIHLFTPLEVRENFKGIRVRGRSADADGIHNAINFQIRNCASR